MMKHYSQNNHENNSILLYSFIIIFSILILFYIYKNPLPKKDNSIEITLMQDVQSRSIPMTSDALLIQNININKTNNDNSILIQYKTEESPDDVLYFYEMYLQSHGWTLKNNRGNSHKLFNDMVFEINLEGSLVYFSRSVKIRTYACLKETCVYIFDRWHKSSPKTSNN